MEKAATERGAAFEETSLLLFRDDLVFYLFVSGCGNNFLVKQVRFLCVWTAIDDLLRVRGPDTRQRFKLILGCRVDVDQIGIRSHRGRALGRRLGSLRYRHSAV